MSLKNRLNQAAYLSCVSDLLDTPQVRSMQQWHHHWSTTTFEHSLFVSYVAFRLARKWHRDYRMAARMGLLHDLYLYDSHDHSAHPGSQCFDHPLAAVRNARALVDLSPKEENIIASHMWPLSTTMPHSAEAFIVSLADKLCAALDYVRLSRLRRINRWVPDTAFWFPNTSIA